MLRWRGSGLCFCSLSWIQENPTQPPKAQQAAPGTCTINAAFIPTNFPIKCFFQAWPPVSGRESAATGVSLKKRPAGTPWKSKHHGSRRIMCPPAPSRGTASVRWHWDARPCASPSGITQSASSGPRDIDPLSGMSVRVRPHCPRATHPVLVATGDRTCKQLLTQAK